MRFDTKYLFKSEISMDVCLYMQPAKKVFFKFWMASINVDSS